MTDSLDPLVSTLRLLIEEEDPARTAAAFLERVVALAGAESGFVVVRQENGSFEQVFEVGEAPPKEPLERRFSRTLVREAIAGGQLLHLPNLAEDPRVASSESARLFGPVAVLVAPLRAQDEVWGVVYLENRRDLGAFDGAAAAAARPRWPSSPASRCRGRAAPRCCGGATRASKRRFSPATTSRASSPAIRRCSRSCGWSARSPGPTRRF